MGHSTVNTLPQNLIKNTFEMSEKEATAPAAHPTYSVMIAAAIDALNGRNGSSRQAILKSILANYKVNPKKATLQLKKSLKKGVAAGTLKKAREKGKGAGCYKLAGKSKKSKAKKGTKAYKEANKNEKRVVKSKEKKPAARLECYIC